MEVVTYWSTLIRLAREIGRARASGNVERLEEAQKALNNYEKAVLQSDRMILDA